VADFDLLHRAGLDLLKAQTRALDALIQTLAPATTEAVEVEPEDLVVIWLLQAAGVSLHSVVKLATERDMGIRDCFGIARSVAEAAVNAAFVSVGGPAIAERAMRHMRQKRWRDLKRQGRISDLAISVELDLNLNAGEVPGLVEDLAEFTDKKGREVRDWTPETIEQRIEVVAREHGDAARALAAGIFAIYRPSSELLHGTYYGVHYFWQGSRDKPATNRGEFDAIWIEDHFVTLLSALLFSTVGAVQTVARARRVPIEHVDNQIDLLRRLEQLTKLLQTGSECTD
jgi:hypothetical protein